MVGVGLSGHERAAAADILAACAGAVEYDRERAARAILTLSASAVAELPIRHLAAADIIQEVAMKVQVQLDRGHLRGFEYGGRSAEKYVATVAMRVVARRVSREMRRVSRLAHGVRPDSLPDPAPGTYRVAAARSELHDVVRRLEAKFRERDVKVVLCTGAGDAAPVVARRYKLKANNVYQVVNRARRFLRANMDDPWAAGSSGGDR